MSLQEAGPRIRYIRTELLKQSQTRFAAVMQMSQSNLSDIENQKMLPNYFLIYSLHQSYHINIHWLITGKGEPTLPPDEGAAQEIS